MDLPIQHRTQIKIYLADFQSRDKIHCVFKEQEILNENFWEWNNTLLSFKETLWQLNSAYVLQFAELDIKFSFCLWENTLNLHFKDQPVNTIYRSTPQYWVSYKTHKYIL